MQVRLCLVQLTTTTRIGAGRCTKVSDAGGIWGLDSTTSLYAGGSTFVAIIIGSPTDRSDLPSEMSKH